MTYTDLLTDHRLLLLEVFERGAIQIYSDKTDQAGLTIDNRRLCGIWLNVEPSQGEIDPDFFRLLAASGFRITIGTDGDALRVRLEPTDAPMMTPHPDEARYFDQQQNEEDPEHDPDEPPTQLPMRTRYTNR